LDGVKKLDQVEHGGKLSQVSLSGGTIVENFLDHKFSGAEVTFTRRKPI
jgi:hypothetical protein